MINWESVTTDKNINHSSQHFIDSIRDAYLYQHVTQPTRYRHGQKHRVKWAPCPQLYSDCGKKRLKEGTSRFNYNQGDYAAINDNLMDIDWTSKCIGMTIEEMWMYFLNALAGQMGKYIQKLVHKKNKRVRYGWQKNLQPNMERSSVYEEI